VADRGNRKPPGKPARHVPQLFTASDTSHEERLPAMLKPKLKDDGKVVLSIGNESLELTAQDLDEQIARLARIRAQMPEKISEQAPLVETVVFNPAYFIRTDNMTKAALLSIRHGGLGWLNFELPPKEVLNMKRTWIDIADKLGLDPASSFYDGPERRNVKPH
jgi:hypothetical protein